MKVSLLPYKRVEIDAFKSSMEDIIRRVRNAGSVGAILAARGDYLRIYEDYYTESSLAYMRYSVNTADDFYVAENDYYDEISPTVRSLMADYASALLDSPFRA